MDESANLVNPGLASPSQLSVADSFALRWRKRTALLIGLLAFQSCSSFILASFETLLQRHSVVVFFLTMLVGAGGNAGNQAAVLVIRGLATGEITPRTAARYVLGEVSMALAISIPMVIAGYLRVSAFHQQSQTDAIAISTSVRVGSLSNRLVWLCRRRCPGAS